ncbi:MAG: Uncharacterised protein [SAR116 cluster bacterium]|nr:MAG: Uncharacterised protein [SAR116 cluster bacterium]
MPNTQDGIFGWKQSSERHKVVVVVNDVIDIRERIEKIREAVENNPVGQTGADTIVPVSSTIELDTIVAENQRQLKADINTEMLQSPKGEMPAQIQSSGLEKQPSSYPSIKLDISNQSRNLGLYAMLAIQILTNIALIFLMYRMAL